MTIRCFLPIFFLFLAGILRAQSVTADSAARGKDTSRIWQTDMRISESGIPTMYPPNNVLDRIQFYQAVYTKSFYNTNLSNNGTAWQNLYFAPEFRNGFDPGFHTFDIYYLDLEKTWFYDCQSPYTKARYIQGAKEEVNFEIIHTQNVQKQLNLGIQFNRVASQGAYQRQATSHQSLRLHSWFRPAKLPYQVFLAANYLNGVCQENGGLSLAGDSLFKAGEESNRILIPVSLDNARNRVFGNGFLIRQTFDPVATTRDTARKGFFRIQHSLHYAYRKMHYEDNLSNPSYYSYISDSALRGVNYSSRLLDNEFALMRLVRNDRAGRVEAKLYYKWQAVLMESSLNSPVNAFNLNSHNHSVGGFLTYFGKRDAQVKLSTAYFTHGFNQGDAQMRLDYSTVILNGNKFESVVQWFRQENAYQMQHFVSNFAFWDLPQTKFSQLEIRSRFFSRNVNWFVDLSWKRFTGYTYLDESQVPVQDFNPVNMLSLYIHHKAHFGKWHLYSRVLGQQNNHNQILRLPLIQLQESLFREGKLGGKTTWRIGVDLTALSKYRPSAYQPYSGLFYLQNTQTNSSLFQADLYVSAKIRRALAFIKLEHFNSGLGTHRSIPVPGYPASDLGLKLGLNWLFFD